MADYSNPDITEKKNTPLIMILYIVYKKTFI